MTLNEQAILKMLNDSSFYDELNEYLNALINAELQKPDSQMDCNLIEECTNILLSAESGDKTNAAILIPFVSSERLIDMAKSKTGFASLSKGARAAIIAAAAAALMLGSNAAVAATTGVNVLSNLGTAVYETLEDWGIIKSDAPQETACLSNGTEEGEIGEAAPDETAQEAPAEETAPQPAAVTVKEKTEEGEAGSAEESAPVALRLSFADDFKTQYYWGESLNLNGLTVTAVYNENKTKAVPVSDCSVSGYNRALEGTQKILVEYRGTKASFEITLSKTEKREDRFVTGVEGTPPTKQVYTTEDTTLLLGGLKVRLIYSDGSYSEYYTHNSATIVKGADFTQAGEQKITLRIAGKADYTYTIIVNEIAVAVDIKELEQDNYYTFYVGDNPLYSNLKIKVKYTNGETETLLYSEHAEEIEIYNLDTSEETNTAKQFTVGYKGHYATHKYTVIQRRTPGYAKFSGGMPKFIYYKGEPLCYGKDVGWAELRSSIAELESSNQDLFGGITDIYLGSDNFSVLAYYVETIGNKYERYYPANLDFVGYDPYTEGYQVIDLYYEGAYLTSYLVFVYGDEGYCPSVRTSFEILQGSETKNLGSSMGTYENGAMHYYMWWYKCAGNGKLSKLSNDIIRAELLLDDESVFGRASATAHLENGSTVSFEVNHLKTVKKVEAVYDESFVSIPLESLYDYDFGSSHFIVTLANGETEAVYLNDAVKGYSRPVSYRDGFSERAPVSAASDIHSALGSIRFMLDSGVYSNVNLGYLNVFYYREGYENTLQLICEHETLEQGAYYDTSYTDSNFRKNVRFYISAYDNRISLDYKDITVEGVEWGTVGDYTATIKTTYNGTEFSCTQEIHIVD